jgi:hypothetical protein
MRKIVLRIVCALVIVSLPTQMAGAAPRSERKMVRAPVHAARQFREAHDSMPNSAPNSAPRPGSKSCDRFWCYEN